MDLSEQCGYSVQAQIQLFKSIKPLFSNKLVFLVINKIDVTRPEDLDTETQAEIQGLLKSGEVEMLQLSCNTQEGVQDVKNAACERLIAERVNQKLKAGTNTSGAVGGRLADVMARIHVAQPMGGQVRETFIPEGIKNSKKYDKADPERRKLARDVEEENGGAGVFSVDMKADYLLKNPEWKYDKIPEIWDGKNVYDYVDPDIDAKLAALEAEEEQLEKEGYYESEEEMEDDEEADVMRKAELIREKQQLIRNEARMKKRLKNQAIIPRKQMKKSLSEFGDAMDSLGVDARDLTDRAREKSRPRGRSMSRSRLGTADAETMDVDGEPKSARDRLRDQSRARSQSRAPLTNRRDEGMGNDVTRTNAERIAKLNQRRMNRMARQGEADRHIGTAMPKHLVSRIRASKTLNCRLTCCLVCRKTWYGQDIEPIKLALLCIRVSILPFRLSWGGLGVSGVEWMLQEKGQISESVAVDSSTHRVARPCDGKERLRSKYDDYDYYTERGSNDQNGLTVKSVMAKVIWGSLQISFFFTRMYVRYSASLVIVPRCNRPVNLAANKTSITQISSPERPPSPFQHASATRLLLIGHVDAVPQALDLELLAGGAVVDVLDVVGGGLEVAGGIVALGDEDVVLGAVGDGLVHGDRGALGSMACQWFVRLLGSERGILLP